MGFNVKTPLPSLSAAVRGLPLFLRRALVMALAALLLAAVFSWPLPRHFARGVVYTAFERTPGPPLADIPGDHLQFLYHLWLAQDTLLGHTPLFHDLYEFNTGDDAARRSPTPYYLPFSAFFAAASIPFGQAAGWNFAGWMSLFLTGLFAWALARRYVPPDASPLLPALLALIPLAFPYTWVNLLSGSPTGLALVWIPVLLYGLDRWVADASPAGAAWAGAALFFSEWSDTHVFFFGALVSPFWIAFAWQHRHGFRLPRAADLRRLLASAWPLLLFAVLAAAKAWAISRALHGTAVAAGRNPAEVALFSVSLHRLWLPGGLAKTWVGLPALAVAALFLVLAVAALFRPASRRAAVSLLLLLAALTAIALLATGTSNPFGPRAWALLVRLVPPYRMIRQADKIYCLAPTLAMLATALAAAALPPPSTSRRRVLRTAVALLLAFLVLRSWLTRHSPGICLLDTEQPAYAAIAADAASRGTAPRAVALPLWPGDCHLSSVYQHDSSLYRIRMLNGYRPTVRQQYREEIFDPLESVNLGNPSPEQLDNLASRGIDYLVFHEDAFPPNVSLYPSGATLVNLLSHPRLLPLAHADSVWSFRIAPESPSSPTSPLALPRLFPSRTWNWKNSLPLPSNCVPVEGPSADSDCWLRAYAPMDAPVTSRWLRVTGPCAWQWRFRARGTADIEWTTRDTSGASATATLPIDASDWTWHALPATIPGRPAIPGGEWEITADFRLLSGTADMDCVLLTGTPSLPPSESSNFKSEIPNSGNSAFDFPPSPGAITTLPALAFHRLGDSDPTTGAVTLRPDRTPATDVLVARNFWLDPGPHRITLDFATPAPSGTPLGTLTLRVGAGPTSYVAAVPVTAGEPAILPADIPDNRLARLSFRYTRAAPVTLRAVAFEHLPSPALAP